MVRLIDLRIAVRALSRARLRTALTTLGIGIGIAAVILTVSLGQGASNRVQAQLDALGDDVILVQGGAARVFGARDARGSRRSLYPRDAQAMALLLPGVAACSPIVSGREQVISEGQNWNTRYQGVSEDFLAIRHWPLKWGSNFTPVDMQQQAKVMILGANVATHLYGDEIPIGKRVRMRQFAYTVIGVLEPRGAGRGGLNLDDQLLLPYTTAQRRVEGIFWTDEIICAATDPLRLPEIQAQMAAVLRDMHGLGPDKPDDFHLVLPQESLQMRVDSMNTMTIMLGSIAAVSLLVGGIGIMNIMLVSVAERTREIGVRLAVGARMRDIRRQFLAEALSLGSFGGMVGVTAGVLTIEVVRQTLNWPMVLSVETVLIAVGFAMAAGVVFGYYPAIAAARLDPIEALRTEH
jgi:putative ABC transport system permease protein